MSSKLINLTLVAVGGNAPSTYGCPLDTVRGGISELERAFGNSFQSALYKTPAFPKGNGPDFVNGAVAIRTDMAARDILATLHRIEAQFERERTTRWGQRTLDLDLIAVGDQILPDRAYLQTWIDMPFDQQTQTTPDQLILPHPRLQDRAFVLVPLMDVAPDWRHPTLGQTVAQMHAALPVSALAEVVPIGPTTPSENPQ